MKSRKPPVWIGVAVLSLLAFAVALAVTPFSYDPSVHDIPADQQCVKERPECPWRGACVQEGNKCMSCLEGGLYERTLGCYTCPQGMTLQKVNGAWSCEDDPQNKKKRNQKKDKG